MTHKLGFQPGLALCAALAFCFLGLPAAHAGDRPFLVVSSAALEDDAQSWTLGTRWRRTGADNALELGVEYGFSRATSLELEWAVERAGGSGKRSREAELELKHVFNDMERDGVGVGLALTLGLDRERADEGDGDDAAPAGPRRGRRNALVQVPLSLPLWDGQGLAHVNLGWQRRPFDGGQGFVAVGLERPLAERTLGFAEAVHQRGQHLLHAGVRHWLREERLALDVGVQRLQDDGRWRSGVVVGLVAYEL